MRAMNVMTLFSRVVFGWNEEPSFGNQETSEVEDTVSVKP